VNIRYATHLAGRFAGSLWPGGPSTADDDWAMARLGPGERRLWSRMSGPDRRHALGVARRVERALGHEATRPVVAAALLHDVGKLDSRLGTFGRVAATLTTPLIRDDWVHRRGVRRRFARYRNHGELGAGMLRMAEADPLTVAWAREHHLPKERWTVPAPIAAALKAADDD
jgi:hypothetical protein